MRKRNKVSIVIAGILCFLFLITFNAKNKSVSYGMVSNGLIKKWEKSNWIFLISGTWNQPAGKQISEYYPLTDHIIPVLKTQAVIRSVSATPDLKNYAFSYCTYSLKDQLWKSELVRLDHHGQTKILFSSSDKKEMSIHGLSWSSSGQKLCFLLGALPEKTEVWLNQKLFIVDVSTGNSQEYGVISCYGYTGSVSLTPMLGPYPIWSEDDQSIYFGSSDKEICKFDLTTGKYKNIGKGCAPIYEKNSKLVILADNPYCLKEISLKSGQTRILSVLDGIRGFARCIVSPDHKLIGINYTPKEAKPIGFFCLFWDIENGIVGDLPQTILGWGKKTFSDDKSPVERVTTHFSRNEGVDDERR